MIHILGLSLLLILSSVTKNKEQTFCFYIGSLLLFIMAVIRFGMGIDYWGYYSMFTIAPSAIHAIQPIQFLTTEPTFLIIAALIKQFNLNFQLLIAIYSGLSFFFVYKTIKRFSCNRMFSLFIFFSNYYLVYTTNAMRQAVAIGIFIYAFFVYIEDFSIIKYLVMIFLAALFHYSAIVLLVIPFILKLPNFLFLKFSSFYFLSFLFILIGCSVPLILLKFIVRFVPRYSYYVTFSINYLTVAFRFFITLLVLLLYHNSKNRVDKIIVNSIVIYVFGGYLFFMLSSISIFSRLVEYCFTLEIIFLPFLIFDKKKYSIENKLYKFIFYCVFSFLCLKDIRFFISVGGFNSNKLYDYPCVTIFNKDSYEKYRKIPLINNEDVL